MIDLSNYILNQFKKYCMVWKSIVLDTKLFKELRMIINEKYEKTQIAIEGLKHEKKTRNPRKILFQAFIGSIFFNLQNTPTTEVLENTPNLLLETTQIELKKLNKLDKS